MKKRRYVDYMKRLDSNKKMKEIDDCVSVVALKNLVDVHVVEDNGDIGITNKNSTAKGEALQNGLSVKKVKKWKKKKRNIICNNGLQWTDNGVTVENEKLNERFEMHLGHNIKKVPNEIDVEITVNGSEKRCFSMPSKYLIDGYDVVDSNSSLIIRSKQKNIAKPFELFQFSDGSEDSVQIGLKAFHWLIGPVDNQIFFQDIFQKKAMVIHRQSSNYYEGLFSLTEFFKIVQEKYLEYGTNINVALYKDGVRTTLNGNGRVNVHVLQQHFNEGHSVQCVNPQTFDTKIWYICEILQEIFCSFVGANNYITPKYSEGFAPHWDDVDAFLLQLEGRKHWTICAPPSKWEAFPLESSENFTDDILTEWPVVFSGWLEQGDVLYIPRGFIHKANTNHELSHHVTISTCRLFSYSDLLEKALPNLLEKLKGSNSKFRSGLPSLLFDMAGVANINYPSEESYYQRVYKPCIKFMKRMTMQFAEFCPVFVDEMAADFMKSALPPLLTPLEQEYSCVSGNVSAAHIPYENAEIRLIRRHGQRLLYSGENEAYIIHRMANSRIYKGHKEILLSFPIELEDGFTILAKSYPQWIKANELNLSKENTKELIQLLYNNFLLLVKFNNETTVSHVARKRKCPHTFIIEKKQFNKKNCQNYEIMYI